VVSSLAESQVAGPLFLLGAPPRLMFKPCVAFEQSFVKLLSKLSQSFDQLSSRKRCGLRVSLKVTRSWFACIFEGHLEDLVLESSCWGGSIPL